MRRASRTDRNHAAVVAAFRACGCSVFDTSAVGKGFPDLTCSIGLRETFLVEVKDGTKSPSKRLLTPAQVEFRASWRGTVLLVTDAADVPGLVNAMRRAIRP